MIDFNKYNIDPNGKLKNASKLRFVCPKRRKEYITQYVTVKNRIKREGGNFDDYDFLCMVCKAYETNLKNHGGVHNSRTPEYLQMVRETSIERYGKPNHSQTEDFRIKSTQTLIEHFGPEVIKDGKANPMYLESSKQKIIETNRKHWGKDWYSQTDECKKRTEETNLERYGQRRPDHSEKAKKTQFDEIGCWRTQTQEYRDKTLETNIRKYGAPNHQQANFPKETLEILLDKERFRKVLESGDSCNHVAEALEISIATVHNYMKKYELQDLIYYPIRSIGEDTLINYIKSLYDGEIILNSRTIIPPQEIDIYIPELNLAFEYNGTFWHSSDRRINPEYHSEKSSKCFERGINLIHIFEAEWKSNRSSLESLIRYNLTGEYGEDYNIEGNTLYLDFPIKKIPEEVDYIIQPVSRGKYNYKGFELSKIEKPEAFYVTDAGEISKQPFNKKCYEIFDSGKFVYARKKSS